MNFQFLPTFLVIFPETCYIKYSLNLNQSKSTDSSVKINCFNSERYFFTDESVKRQITDSISENLTDSDLESSIVLGLTGRNSQ